MGEVLSNVFLCLDVSLSLVSGKLFFGLKNLNHRLGIYLKIKNVFKGTVRENALFNGQ